MNKNNVSYVCLLPLLMAVLALNGVLSELTQQEMQEALKGINVTATLDQVLMEFEQKDIDLNWAKAKTTFTIKASKLVPSGTVEAIDLSQFGRYYVNGMSLGLLIGKQQTEIPGEQTTTQSVLLIAADSWTFQAYKQNGSALFAKEEVDKIEKISVMVSIKGWKRTLTAGHNGLEGVKYYPFENVAGFQISKGNFFERKEHLFKFGNIRELQLTILNNEEFPNAINQTNYQNCFHLKHASEIDFSGERTTFQVKLRRKAQPFHEIQVNVRHAQVHTATGYSTQKELQAPKEISEFSAPDWMYSFSLESRSDSDFSPLGEEYFFFKT